MPLCSWIPGRGHRTLSGPDIGAVFVLVRHRKFMPTGLRGLDRALQVGGDGAALLESSGQQSASDGAPPWGGNRRCKPYRMREGGCRSRPRRALLLPGNVAARGCCIPARIARSVVTPLTPARTAYDEGMHTARKVHAATYLAGRYAADHYGCEEPTFKIVAGRPESSQVGATQVRPCHRIPC